MKTVERGVYSSPEALILAAECEGFICASVTTEMFGDENEFDWGA